MKTSTQLNSEISEALAASRLLTAKRAKDFRETGTYELRDASGAVVAMMFRDPESRWWYEENMPGVPQTHYSERWRGFTQAEAIANISKRRDKRR
jgi:hypothetical protein